MVDREDGSVEVEERRVPFTEGEKTEIAYWAAQLYTDRGAITLDKEEARKQLIRIGCDLSEADRLFRINLELSPAQLAQKVIERGKASGNNKEANQAIETPAPEQ